MTITKISDQKCFGGWQQRFSHASETVNCDMKFSIFIPPNASKDNKVPVLYFLAGLTCNDENFVQKAGAQRIAAELGIAIVTPDTSPRNHSEGNNVADDENKGYDLGLGAGFYLNAVQEPWRAHYQMYDYISDELPQLIEANFDVNDKRAISGHSMGGHGALTIGLKNPDLYTCISAFSPICNPVNCPWGIKAFSNYLGNDKQAWLPYDAAHLLTKSQSQTPILIDQGLDDEFLETQLGLDAFIKVAKTRDQPIAIGRHQGYDHSYFFIASFIENQLRFHAKHLSETKNG